MTEVLALHELQQQEATNRGQFGWGNIRLALLQERNTGNRQATFHIELQTASPHWKYIQRIEMQERKTTRKDMPFIEQGSLKESVQYNMHSSEQDTRYSQGWDTWLRGQMTKRLSG